MVTFEKIFSSDLNEIWYVGRGRWVMHDGMPYGRNQDQGQGHSREVDRQSPMGLIFVFETDAAATLGKWDRFKHPLWRELVKCLSPQFYNNEYYGIDWKFSSLIEICVEYSWKISVLHFPR